MTTTTTQIELTETAIIIDLGGVRLTSNPANDPRISEVVDGKIFTVTEEAAVELADELQSMGVSEARAFGHAVVFWS